MLIFLLRVSVGGSNGCQKYGTKSRKVKWTTRIDYQVKIPGITSSLTPPGRRARANMWGKYAARLSLMQFKTNIIKIFSFVKKNAVEYIWAKNLHTHIFFAFMRFVLCLCSYYVISSVSIRKVMTRINEETQAGQLSLQRCDTNSAGNTVVRYSGAIQTLPGDKFAEYSENGGI